MKRILMAVAGSMMALMLAACSVEKTQEGEMPKVSVEGGQVPKYDVKTADVNVGSTTQTMTVPDVDINTKQTEVKVPNVDVTMPSEKK